jgi:hypothetical protein
VVVDESRRNTARSSRWAWWSRRRSVRGFRPDPGRVVGGEHVHHRGDQGSVTGTGVTGVFVGRIAGDDLGHAGPSGAERRRECAAPARHQLPARSVEV